MCGTEQEESVDTFMSMPWMDTGPKEVLDFKMTSFVSLSIVFQSEQRDIRGVAIKKPDCFYYSFPAKLMTKRRVRH